MTACHMESGKKQGMNLRIAILFIVLLSSCYELFGQHHTAHTYYDDDHTILKETFSVLEGKERMLDGKYISYYENGNLKSEGYYRNNKPTGYWNYYYENGKLKMRGQLKGKSTHGVWQYYYENGQLSMEGEIHNGKREGIWKFYFESGPLKSKGEFINGEKTGIWNHYYEDGTLKAQAFYKNDRGYYKEFYTNGNVKLEGYNLNGKSDSTWTYYYENGLKKAEGKFNNGLRNGSWAFYHKNGNKSAEGKYVDGEKNGEWTYYHENGKISSEGFEIEGKKEGHWRIYDNQGSLKGEGVFEQGTGEYKEFHENGNLKVIGRMENGVREGKWMYYYENGTLEGECLFVHGEGSYIGYYPDGNIKMKGRIKDGKNVGEWELYKADGTLEGYYRPIYEEDEPVFKVSEKSQKKPGGPFDYLKPDYRYKKRYNRYFSPVINEYKGFILATNPAAVIVGSIPLSIEYYFQERLGHEIQLNIIRDPFFSSDQSIQINSLYKRGFDVALKQKYYHPDNGLGMFYFANELRYTSLNHYFNALDSTLLPINTLFKVQANETLLEYSFIGGNRWMRLFGERWQKGRGQTGITVDVFLGIGVGYRRFQKKYNENPAYDKIFDDLRQSNFSVSPRFGVNIGYVF